MTLDSLEAQELLEQLLEQLLRVGIKPKDQKDQSALQAHLEDMRTIAFKFINKD